MDSLPAQLVDGIRQAIEACGAELVHLPPYSLEINRIERLFAKPEALLRKTGARTVSALRAAIGALLKNFEPDERVSYLPPTGYGST